MAEMKIQGLDGVLDMLKKLPPEVTQSKQGGMVNLAMRKGARLMQKKQKEFLQAAIDKNGSESTGLLMKNLQIKRGKYSGKGHKLLLTVRRKSYPKKSEGEKRPASTRQTANLLEYGSSTQPATPWIRPAFNATAEQTIMTITDDLSARLDKAAKKLLQEGK